LNVDLKWAEKNHTSSFDKKSSEVTSEALATMRFHHHPLIFYHTNRAN